MWKSILTAVSVLPGIAAADTCAVICDDFEGDLSAWRLNLGPGSYVELAPEAAHGAQSVQVTVTKDRRWAFLETDIPSELANGPLWGRLFLKIREARSAEEGLVHWTFVEAQAREETLAMFRYGGISAPALGRHHLLWNHERRPRPDGFKELSQDDDHTAMVPLGEWLCIEWLFDAGQDLSQLFLNGEERRALRSEMDLPPLDVMAIGWTIYQPILSEQVVWIDEVALGSERIGCD